MKAEIIAVGSELTSGQNLNTNSQWLSRRLAEIGIPVRWHTTLADDLEENVQAFQVARGRARLVLITGGLGPTQDDLTREALAKFAGVELIFHEPSYEQIKQLFASRNRPMPERNRVQALLPAGSEPLPNARGTAPGIWLPVGDAVFVALPGVPGEMHAMFEAEVKPRIQRWAGATGVLVERKINCFGAGESAIEAKLLDLTRRGHVPEVGITVSDATVSLRIIAHAPDRASALRQIEPVERTIRERLGELVYGVDEEDLQHAVAKLLAEKRQTLAVAESVTGGLIAHRLTEVAGVSAHFRGGLVAYDNSVKAEWLAVPQRLLDEHGAVSPQVAEAMAVGCRTRFRTDLALAATGPAGPGGGTPDKPVGLAYVALAWAGGVKSVASNWPATRPEIQSRTAKVALNLARLHLLSLPG
jgi:nicotinamide-nucleotide amidase